MNRPPAFLQVALIVGAMIVGVLVDRLLLAGSGVPETRRASAIAATRGGAQEAAAAASGSGGVEKTAPATATDVRTAAGESGAGLDSVLAEHDPRQRLLSLQDFINHLPVSGFADALKRLRQIPHSNERELASRLLVARWVQSDPDGALQFAAGNRGFEYVAEDVFQAFAAADFSAAMGRASAIPGNDLRYRALKGILSFKADSDPRAALELASTMGDFRGMESLASVVYRQWAAVDPQAAANHAAAQTPAEGDGWRSPVRSVVDTWAAQDPVAAANFSIAMKDAEAQRRSLDQVMRQWSRDDPQGAANWIYALEPGPSRDNAVAGLAQSLAFADPQTAVGWVGTITDDQTRQRTLQRISGVVMWRDPQNGAALLQSAGLPADQIRGGRGGRGGGGGRPPGQ